MFPPPMAVAPAPAKGDPKTVDPRAAEGASYMTVGLTLMKDAVNHLQLLFPLVVIMFKSDLSYLILNVRTLEIFDSLS